MQLKPFCPLLYLFFFTTSSAGAAVNVMMINGGVIRTSNEVPNHTLLKTLPVYFPTASTLPGDYKIIASPALSDSRRGVYRSGIPGIGFSLCQDEGENCLIPREGKIAIGAGYKLRLYKIGDLKGGVYSPGALIMLANGSHKLRLHLARLTIHNMACVMTRNNIEVHFPTTTLSNKKVKLAEVPFTLPISCHDRNDYHNVMLTFNYRGQHYDETTMETNLSGLGIRLRDASGKQVNIEKKQPESYRDRHFIASLVRLPGRRAEAGNFNISATVTISMR